jgi:hypothetical protein
MLKGSTFRFIGTVPESAVQRGTGAWLSDLLQLGEGGQVGRMSFLRTRQKAGSLL